MKKFIRLTLASNKKTVVIDKEVIAFAIEEEDNGFQYTRIYLKTDGEIQWIDVLEKSEKIM